MANIERQTEIAIFFFEEFQKRNPFFFNALNQHAKERYGYSVFALCRKASERENLVPLIFALNATNGNSAREQLYDFVNKMKED